MGKPEGMVEDHLVRRCREHDYLCYKFVSPGHNGVPDRIVISNGKTTYVEIKAANGRLSRLQELCHERMRGHGADVRVVWSKDEVDQLVRELSGGT